jgi:hypothetical protein
MAGVITLLKNVTLCGDNAQSFNTEWVSFPAEYVNAQMTVVVHSRTGTSSATIVLQTTWDTDSVIPTGGTVTTGAPTSTVSNITANLGPLVRLNITYGGASTFILVSVFLTPKSS